MNGVVRVDLANFITVGLIAFLFIFVANFALRKAGFDKFTV